MSRLRDSPPSSARRTGPGPAPVPPAVLRSLDLAVLKRVESLVPGEHLTPQVGAGTELAMIRPYFPGDDVRHIDWNVTARMREPHVRVHVGERALTAWLVLDSVGVDDVRHRRPAQGRRRRGRRARRSATSPRGAATGSASCRSAAASRSCCARARAGSACSAAGRAARASPRTRARARPRSARALARRRRGGARARPGRGRLRLPRRARLGGPLRSLRARHGVLAVEIRDPREQELTPMGDLWLVDPETGRQLQVNTSGRSVRQRFAEAAAAEREEVAAALRRAGADHLVLSTEGDWLRDARRPPAARPRRRCARRAARGGAR